MEGVLVLFEYFAQVGAWQFHSSMHTDIISLALVNAAIYTHKVLTAVKSTISH